MYDSNNTQPWWNAAMHRSLHTKKGMVLSILGFLPQTTWEICQSTQTITSHNLWTASENNQSIKTTRARACTKCSSGLFCKRKPYVQFWTFQEVPNIKIIKWAGDILSFIVSSPLQNVSLFSQSENILMFTHDVCFSECGVQTICDMFTVHCLNTVKKKWYFSSFFLKQFQSIIWWWKNFMLNAIEIIFLLTIHTKA